MKDGATGRTTEILLKSEMISCRLTPQGSNYTFLALLEARDGSQHNAIYKPRIGEAPLWDFPDGTLYQREYAAYLLSEALGWKFVPATVIRQGPHGIGSVQLFVEHIEEESYFSILDSGKYTLELQQICLFDWITNNADRKASHCLLGKDGRIWGIDHGLTFNNLPALRTVIWDFRGYPIPESLIIEVQSALNSLDVHKELAGALENILEPDEIIALRERMKQLTKAKSFPLLSDSRRSFPWPLF
jgi:uncharacterized repeat protein (TIGR03843 family)